MNTSLKKITFCFLGLLAHSYVFAEVNVGGFVSALTNTPVFSLSDLVVSNNSAYVSSVEISKAKMPFSPVNAWYASGSYGQSNRAASPQSIQGLKAPVGSQGIQGL